jgi:hypothetical protein
MLLAFFRPFPPDPNNGSLDVPLRERCEPKLEASIGRCQWEGKAIAARVVRRLIRILVRNYPSPHCNLYLPHNMLYAWSFCNTLSRTSIHQQRSMIRQSRATPRRQELESLLTRITTPLLDTHLPSS